MARLKLSFAGMSLIRISLGLALLAAGLGRLDSLAQEQPAPPAPRAPLAPVTSDRAGALQAALEDGHQATGVVGAAAAVVFADGARWSGAAGWSDPGRGLAMRPGLMFNVGSISKNYLAALALRMVERGKLSLEDTVGDYFADLPHVDPGITVRQLLNHTSGIFDFVKHAHSPWQNALTATRLWSSEEILNTLVEEPYFAPGEGWHYSNTNYLLIRDILQQIADRSYERLFVSELVQPLGLEHTVAPPSGCFVLETESAPVYWKRMYGQLWNISATGQAWESTNYRVLATAGELAAWIDALYHRKTVLAEPLLAEMLDYHAPTPNDFPLSGYGLGTCYFDRAAAGQLVGQAEVMIGHFGNGIGYKTAALYFPEHGFSIVAMVNEDSVPGLIGVLQAVLEATLSTSS